MRIEDLWQDKTLLGFGLFPLSLLYCAITKGRALWYAQQDPYQRQRPAFKAIIVVGNLTVGGTGKTPMVIWLCDFLRRQNLRPGVVSRGYGGKVVKFSREVTAHSDPAEVGDEPVMLARHTHCPVVVDVDRLRAAHTLRALHDCDILISDDGLQHHALPRDIEIVMVDGERRFGNGLCLPAGPLRESVSRLNRVDFVVSTELRYAQSHIMHLVGNLAIPLDGQSPLCKLASFKQQPVHAVAGIGNPERFFTSLRKKGLRIIPHAYPDHHRFRAADIRFNDDYPVLMTEKDSVKCKAFADDRHYFVPVKAHPEARFVSAFAQRLQAVIHLNRFN